MVRAMRWASCCASASLVGYASAFALRAMADANPPYDFAFRYCRFLSVAAAAAGVGLGAAAAAGAWLGASAGALLLPLLAPNNSRVGFLSRLFTARLMSPNVLRPSDIRSPERLSKSSASSRIDFTA